MGAIIGQPRGCNFRKPCGLLTRTLHGQGATEYLVVIGVLLLLVVMATSLLGFLPNTAADAKKETYMAQLRSGEPFAVEEYSTDGGKLTITFANKANANKKLAYVIFSSPEMNLTEGLGTSQDFSAGMRKVVSLDVPCAKGEREFGITLVYEENGKFKEQSMGGKLVVSDCAQSKAVPGEGCSTDADCAAGSCNAGVCEISVGVCSSNEQCESGNCNVLTHLCDASAAGECSPRCSLENSAIVCSETLSSCDAGWEESHSSCSVSADCQGRYGDCSLVCGGTCAGSNQTCGAGRACCDGFTCTLGVCVATEGSAIASCSGVGGACGSGIECCTNTYCSSNASGYGPMCLACKTSGACNATQCCSGYACGTGYVSIDVPRNGTECGLPDGNTCSANSQCLNGTCYFGLCKNCNTNNECNIANGNGDCCYGKQCMQNSTGGYTCQSIVQSNGSEQYLYDTSWSMRGNWAVVYRAEANGSYTNARNFGNAGGVACTRNEECLSNVCTAGVCESQTAGSWCRCPIPGSYTTCTCPSGLICDPNNYTCVGLPKVDAPVYRFICDSTGICPSMCYDNYTQNPYGACTLTSKACKPVAKDCTANAQCCSNSCSGGLCTTPSANDWCQYYSYAAYSGSAYWPLGTPFPSGAISYCPGILGCQASSAYSGNWVCEEMPTANISGCIVLSQANTRYELTADIAANQSPCFDVQAQNVTVDCNGHTVTAGGQLVGFGNNGYDYATLTGCGLNGFALSADIQGGADYMTFSNNIVNYSVTGSGAGVQVYNSQGNTISGNTFNMQYSTAYPIYFEGVNASTISTNTVNTGQYREGIVLLNSNSNVVNGNVVTSVGDAALYLYNANFNNLSSNTLTTTGSGIGLWLYGSAINRFIGNTIDSASGRGINILSGSTSNYFQSNTNAYNYGGTDQKFYAETYQQTTSNGNLGWWPLSTSNGEDALTQPMTAWYPTSSSGWYGGTPGSPGK